MKINKIDIQRTYEKLELKELRTVIDFDTANSSEKTDGDALYYLICALQKCNGKSHKDLGTIEKMEVLNRLDSSIARLKQIKKEIL